jgi:hypothetical protein
VETELHGKGTRCDVVCAAKSGKEIVERGLVRQVDGGEPQAPASNRQRQSSSEIVSGFWRVPRAFKLQTCSARNLRN